MHNILELLRVPPRMAKQTPDQCTRAAWKFVVDLKVSKYPSRLSVASVYSSRRRVPNHLSLILGSLVSFFPGSLVSFFSGSLVSLCFFRNNSSSENPFWPALGCRSGFTPFRASAWVCSCVLSFGFRSGFAPFPPSVWVYSF